MSLLFCSLLCLLSFNTATTNRNNEAPDSTQKHDYAYYLQKSKRQLAAGTIITAVGVAGGSLILFFAFIAALGDTLVYVASLGTYVRKKNSYTIPLIVAGAVTGIGITLLVMGASNRKKARHLSFDAGVGSTTQLQLQSIRLYVYPQLSLKFHF